MENKRMQIEPPKNHNMGNRIISLFPENYFRSLAFTGNLNNNIHG